MKKELTKAQKYDALLKRYHRLCDKSKVEVLLEALEYMQQYNGRTISDCIVLAQGGGYRD